MKPTNEPTKKSSNKNNTATKNKQIGVHVKTGPNKQPTETQNKLMARQADKENRAYNSKVKRPFGTTSVCCGDPSVVAEQKQFEYPTYFPVTN